MAGHSKWATTKHKKAVIDARRAKAFAKYIKARWGRPVECGPTLKTLLVEIIGSPEVYKKIIGMQMIVANRERNPRKS